MKNTGKLKLGEIFELEIIDLTSSGEGVGKIDNFTIFVDKTVPGDKVKVEIIKVKSNYAIAKVLEYLKKSENRSKNICPYLNECGGCSYGILDYQKQLKLKENNLKECLRRIGGFNNLKILPIIGSETENYRNKAQFKVSDNGLGFYKKGSHEIVNIQDCNIQSKAINSMITEIDSIIKKENIPIYNETNFKGILKGVLIRSNKKQEVLITFIINGDSLPNQKAIVNSLKEKSNVIGIYLNINKSKGNKVLGEQTKCLYKEKDLIESIGNKKFKISPNSFFQVNINQIEVLYNIVKEFANITNNDELLDLYCGTGSIGIYIAEENTSLTGIEMNKAAIEDAIYNAQLNNLENSKFYVGKAEEVVNKLNLQPTCIILDPPRKGCDKELLDYILNLEPEKIVYVSCNPSTLARDLKILSSKYMITKIQPVDMFPNTGHLETVSQLIKKK